MTVTIYPGRAAGTAAAPPSKSCAMDAVCVFGSKDIIEASDAGLAVIDLLNE